MEEHFYPKPVIWINKVFILDQMGFRFAEGCGLQQDNLANKKILCQDLNCLFVVSCEKLIYE